jgi:hypothetical protein
MRPSVKERWFCPECDRRLVLFVRASAAPTCQNPDKHSTKIVKMERAMVDGETE